MSPRGLRLSVIATIVFASFAAGAGGYAMATTGQLAIQPLDAPVVLAGEDVGFRVMGRQGERAVGQLVVRLDGKWVDTAPPTGVVRVPR